MPKLASFDPLAVPVQAGDINLVRNALETVPVLVGTLWLDFDALSERRMADALESFTLLGVTELPWTLADNRQEAVTREQLQRLFLDCKEHRALRALELHQEATQLKQRPQVTQRDLVNWVRDYLMPSRDAKEFTQQMLAGSD